jgi:ribosomal protein S8
MNQSNLFELRSKLMIACQEHRDSVMRTQSTGRLVMDVLHRMVEHGYLSTWKRREDGRIHVILRYTNEGKAALKGITCFQGTSLPHTNLWSSVRGHGLHTRLMTTSRGVMTDHESRRLGLGGKPLLRIK